MGLVFPRLADQLGNRQIAPNRYFFNSYFFQTKQWKVWRRRRLSGHAQTRSRVSRIMVTGERVRKREIWVYLVSLVHYT
jgi:hypothetical protein